MGVTQTRGAPVTWLVIGGAVHKTGYNGLGFYALNQINLIAQAHGQLMIIHQVPYAVQMLYLEHALGAFRGSSKAQGGAFQSPPP